jgi:hypothetical protein
MDLQEGRASAAARDVAVHAVELVRDSAAEAYAQATGEAWSPWRGAVRAGVSAAQVEAEAAIRATAARRRDTADAGDQVVAFRASPRAEAPEDARRIFDALNWAQAQWPGMSLALTGAPAASASPGAGRSRSGYAW